MLKTNKMIKIKLTFISLVIFKVGFSQVETIEPDKIGFSVERLQRIDNFFNDIVDSRKIGGAVTLISRDNQIGYLKSFGYSDVKRKIPLADDFIIPIGSMTKIITSVAVLQLYEKGLFLLNDPIDKYIPELKDLVVISNPYQPITDSLITEKLKRKPTIRDFLRHTSGMTYYGGGTVTDKLYDKAGFKNWDKSLQEFAIKVGEIPLSFQPGENWDYSLSFDILGFLIERLSGQTLEEYFSENIFKPLEMNSAGFFIPTELTNKFSNLYEFKQGELILQEDRSNTKYLTRPSVFSGGGGWSDSYCGVVCTINDFHNLCLMLLNKGQFKNKQILSRKTVELMIANHIGDLRGKGKGYGLGVGVITSINDYGELGSDHEVHWAGGPYNTYFWIDFEERLIGIMFPNTAPFGHLSMMEKFKILILQAIDE